MKTKVSKILYGWGHMQFIKKNEKSMNSENEWGSLKEIIVGSVPKKYLIPTVKSKTIYK